MRIHYYKFPEGTSRDVMKEYGLNNDDLLLLKGITVNLNTIVIYDWY